MRGISLTETVNCLNDLERSLPDRMPITSSTPGQRMEALLKAIDGITSLLAPVFESTANAAMPAQEIDADTLSFMISVFNRVMEAFQSTIIPLPPPPAIPIRHTRHLSVETAPVPSRAVSPAVLQINSPLPRHATPMMQPTSTPYIPTSMTTSHIRSSSTPMHFSVTTSSSVSAPMMLASSADLPIPGPFRLGQEYESYDCDLNRWVLANTLMYQVRALSKLQKRILVSLSLCATPLIESGLEELSGRIAETAMHIDAMVNQLAED